ncbi:MAG: Fe-S-containing hydro-lyase [Oscillospiraceae bacterium]|nr:Fe-S-containing hydro-lyase [Oscillospiraceae bacterium]
MEHRIQTPLTKHKASAIRSGDTVYFSGMIYTARDAAHKRFIELLDAGKELPFPIEDAVIYYTGPTPAKPGHVIGAAGPTTSYRMDAYTPTLLQLGLRGMIGKGRRSLDVVNAMKEAGAVYFGAIGGAGALLASRIKTCEPIAFRDLGPEAVHRLIVDEFPVVAIIDAAGGNLYETGRAAYLNSIKPNPL